MSKAKAKYTNWSEINWQKLEKKLWKLQKRIFRAKKEENVKLVKQLQKLLVKSFAAKTLAVRKITQDNRGKRTAGIDGVKAIPPAQRFQLVERLQISHKAKPLRRIYIPKAGTDEKRPLSIPTVYSHCTSFSKVWGRLGLCKTSCPIKRFSCKFDLISAALAWSLTGNIVHVLRGNS